MIQSTKDLEYIDGFFSETIGDQTFEHIEYKDVSVYLLVNKSNKDIDY